MWSLAICVYHEMLLSDQSKKNKIRGVMEREKITTKSWLGILKKKEREKTTEESSNIC